MSITKRKKLASIIKKVHCYLQRIMNDGFPVAGAYIFGSYARGDFKKNSDIDLLIISKRFSKDWDKSERYLWQQTRYVDPRIEPVGYSPQEFKKSVILGKIVKKEGIKIL